MRTPLLIGALLVLGLVSGAWGFVQQTPDLTNAAAISGWMKQNAVILQTAQPQTTWGLAAGDADGLQFSGVVSRAGSANGAQIGLRVEQFVPASLPDGKSSLSQLITIQADCIRQTLKPVSLQVFENRNLQGAKVDQALEESATPLAESPMFAAVFREACAGPVPTTEPEVVRWLDSNRVDLQATGYRWFRYSTTPEGVFFIRQILDEDSRTNRPISIMRVERFTTRSTPEGWDYLSQTIDYELSCNERQFRRMSVSYFANRNLSGRSLTQPIDEPLTSIDANAIAAAIYQESCRAVQFQPQFITTPG